MLYVLLLSLLMLLVFRQKICHVTFWLSIAKNATFFHIKVQKLMDWIEIVNIFMPYSNSVEREVYDLVKSRQTKVEKKKEKSLNPFLSKISIFRKKGLWISFDFALLYNPFFDLIYVLYWHFKSRTWKRSLPTHGENKIMSTLVCNFLHYS